MKQQELKDVPTVRILMLGDRGVGKTSLTNLMATTETTPTPASRTIGEDSWHVQVRLHEYPKPVILPPTPTWTTPSSSEDSENYPYMESTPTTTDILYFVEFYDLNSDWRMCRHQRDSFYKNIDGIVLVYSMLDLSSQDSLHDWLYDPLRLICKYRHLRIRSILKRHHVPILVVGTKLDMLMRRPLRRSGSIAHQLNVEEMLVNCLDPESFADKSRNQGKLRDFLNRAVEFKERFPLLSFRHL
ncbi:rab-like protein 3 [Drosophila sechellia]|uniref:GM18198 n=1 Tax=Drosophila sechellia TaxID=7238 RepID=B4I2Q4_DROSE|nr:rab-like protein 3 [Drosophila sechellia]EDW54049.1 GM18198 [Drosophila sechellia]